MLREFNNLELMIVCTTPWNALQGAGTDVLRAIHAEVGQDEDMEEPLSVLEVSLASRGESVSC